jgi:hypothetical protein
MDNKKKKFIEDDSKVSIATGTALGAIGTAEVVALGVVCPACFIGAAGLIGYGVYNKIKEKKAASKQS